MDNKSLILLSKEEYAKIIEANLRIKIYRDIKKSGTYFPDALEEIVLGGSEDDNGIGEVRDLDAGYQE